MSKQAPSQYDRGYFDGYKAHQESAAWQTAPEKFSDGYAKGTAANTAILLEIINAQLAYITSIGYLPKITVLPDALNTVRIQVEVPESRKKV